MMDYEEKKRFLRVAILKAIAQIAIAASFLWFTYEVIAGDVTVSLYVGSEAQCERLVGEGE